MRAGFAPPSIPAHPVPPSSHDSPVSPRRPWRGSVEIAGSLVLWAMLGGVAWQASAGGMVSTLALLPTAALLSGAVAYLIHRGLRHLTANRASIQYRIAVMVAFAGSLAVSLAAMSSASKIGIGLVLALGWGAFLGGLAASARDEGLWEDNYPPSLEIINQVVQAHRSRLRTMARIPRGKRWLDVAGSACALLIASPLAAGVCLLLWLEDPGPLFFVKNSVGRAGRNFRQWKIRTMVRGAEAESGPVWA